MLRGTLGFVSPNALSRFLGFVSPKCSSPLQSSAVIARESGRSSNHQTMRPVCRSSCFINPNSIAPGEGAPGRRWGMCPPSEGGEAPTGAGADRRTRWLSLAAKPVPSAEGNSRPITRTGAPIGASPRRFSFVLETAFWKRTGAAIRNALDSAGFHLRSSASTSPLPDGPM